MTQVVPVVAAAPLALIATLLFSGPVAATGDDAAAIYAEHCAACHGDAGEGVAGVAPNLADDDWIWGGDERSITLTIAHGVRNDEPFSRRTEMPRFGADGLLDDAEIAAVTAHLLAVSEGAPPSSDGAEIYANYCATCHGEALEGQMSGGAPRLSDRIWLFGGTAEEIAAQIADPQHGVMPGWLDTLGEDAVRRLTDHVLGFQKRD